MQRADLLEKTLMLGKIESKRRRGHETVGWHHWLNEHESEETVGDGEGQGSMGLQRVGHDWATEQTKCIMDYQMPHYFMYIRVHW